MRILITGGTGYFGQGLARYLLEHEKDEVCIFSRDEAKQATMRAALNDPDSRLRWFVGDVRDLQRLTNAMEGVDVVVHAAALKRVEVGEYNPAEMVKTNVLGTMNLIQAAKDAHRGRVFPRRVVALSTDKACHPVNAYGASKLMLEKLVLGENNARGMNGPLFAVTRYGNVAGSTGSVINNWRQAVKMGGRIILTDPNATRFWMTLDEAIGLVMHTVKTMRGGELNIPKLPAYRLGDLLDAMVPEGERRAIPVAGLQRGEKLHERMEEDGHTSEQARRMTVDELREALKSV